MQPNESLETDVCSAGCAYSTNAAQLCRWAARGTAVKDRSRYRRNLNGWFALIAVLAASYLACEWLPITEGPPARNLQKLLWFAVVPFFLIPLSGIAGLSSLVVVIILGIIRRDMSWRLLATHCALCFVAFGSLFVVGRPVSGLRTEAFSRLAARSDGLIRAISDHARDNGTPPTSLEALVPKYLRQVPGTGIRAYPEYDYEVTPSERVHETLTWYDLGSREGKPMRGLWIFVEGDPSHAILGLSFGSDDRVLEGYFDRMPVMSGHKPFDRIEWLGNPRNRLAMANSLRENHQLKGRTRAEIESFLGKPDGERVTWNTPWELSVPCPRGGNWDVFVYWPTEAYPDHMQRIGRWAYVHD